MKQRTVDGRAQVNEWFKELDHPLKKELNAVRKIIIAADPKLNERIKWAAPSFYYLEDLVTFNHRNTNQVHLVFHPLAIVENRSALLQGDYKDRRMMYLSQ